MQKYKQHRSANPQLHSRRSTNAQRHKRTRMTYPIARQSRPASAPSSQGQTRPDRPARAQHPACALCPSPRAVSLALLCAARSVSRALQCGVWVCVCVFVQGHAQTGAQTLRRRRRWASPRGAVRLFCPLAWPSGPVVLCPLPRIPSPGLVPPRLASPLWPSPSGALALGHGGSIRRGARGAGALRPGCWCRCPT